MQRVLVVGAAGLLGREVVCAAAAVTGVEVVPSSRDARPGWLQFDAEGGSEATCRLLDESGPLELVVNCAGVLASEIDPADAESVRRAEAVNARFPRQLAAAALERGVLVVHISTDAVFAAGAGRCFEEDDDFAADIYASTKRQGEPISRSALSLRCSFIGRDPKRHHGLLEWLLSQGTGARVSGYVDQVWNGLSSAQVGAVCTALLDRGTFRRAREEGAVHHLYEDPPLTKHELLALCARIFRPDVTVVPAESGRPSTRLLGTRHAVLRECLESAPPRAASLEFMARSGT